MKRLFWIPGILAAANAWAGEAAAPQGPMESLSSFLLMMGMIFGVFYFLLIRPQQKQRQQHEQKVNSLKKGDQIIGAGGIYGTIIGVKDDKAVIKVADNVKIEILKSSITHIVGKENAE